MAQSNQIYRYVVPVDDRPHAFDLSGTIVHVDSRDPSVVEFWAVSSDEGSDIREFQIVGTGQPYPHEWKCVGSVIVAHGHLVWHLMELPR